MANFNNRKKDRAATSFIDSCVQEAHQVRYELEPQWYENWGNYRVESAYGTAYPSKQYPLATGGISHFDLSPVNFLKTPESHQGVNALRALLLAGLFGVRDYVKADPVGDEDVEAANRVSKLVMYGLERQGNFRTNFETLGDSLIFGLGSYSARWREEMKLVPRRFPVPDPTNPDEMLRNPDNGSLMTVLKNVPISVFNDPVLESDDLFDTWFDPSANRFSELLWKVKRFRVSKDKLRSLRKSPYWDEDGINEVLRTKGGDRPVGPDETEHPKLLTENLTLEDIEPVAKYGYYGGWKLEGTIPEDVAKEIGGIDAGGTVIIRIINGIIVQSIQSTQRNGMIGGGSLTILPTGRTVYGLSPLTVIRYLQDVSDTQLILTVQAMIESVYQNYLIGGDMGPNFARDLETRRPREAFTIQGEIDQVAPLPKDYTGLQVASGAMQMLSQTMRQAMNARDPVQGQTRQTGETTATETQIATTAALQNTDQLAILIERDELPRMGHLINDLYYMNLDDEGMVFRRVGETESQDVKYFDIDMVSDIHFVGARSVLNKQGKANQFRDFFTLLASNPLVAASVDWHKAVERYGDEALDLKGLQELMIKDPEEIIARLQSMGMAQTVGPARGGAGQGGGAPEKKARRNPSSGGRPGGNTPAQSSGESS